MIQWGSWKVNVHASCTPEHADSNQAVGKQQRSLSSLLLPVSLFLFGNQLQETRVTGVEREGRIHINPLDLSCVIACLQRQLTHAVAYGDNGDESAAGQKRALLFWGFCEELLRTPFSKQK